MNPGVALAIEKIGSQKLLAERLGVTQPAVSEWLYVSVPVIRAVEIEKATGVSCKLIRPDVFGEES